MKKLLLSLAAVVAMGFAASAEEVTYNFVENDYGMTRLSGSTNDYNANPQVITGEGAVTITVSGEKSSRLWADGLRFYKNSSYTIAVEGGNMTEVVITYKNAAAAGGFDANDATKGGYTVAGTTGTWTGSAAEIGFSCNIAKSNVAISSIKVTYSGGVADTRKDADLVFSAEKVEAVLGETFTAPTLTKATNADVEFESDNEKVATVDANTGVVTLLAAGSARITATAAENDEYRAGTASYLITVSRSNVIFSALSKNSTIDETTNLPEGWTVDNISMDEGLTYVWKWDSYGYLKASAYNQAAKTAESRVISPVIDLTNRHNIAMYFDQAAKFVTTLKDLCHVQVRVENTTSWENLDVETWPAGGDWSFSTCELSLEAYKDKKIQVAFLYGSDAAVGADTWEIKNLEITGDIASGVAEIEADENAPVEYFNLQGIRVANPENGLYIRRQGNNVSKVLVK